MPNLWTKTTQIIYEAFKGPRTVDVEFNGKYDEIKMIVQQIKNISLTIKSFPQKLNGFKDLCNEICQNLIKPFPNDNIFYPTISEIIKAHKVKYIRKLIWCNLRMAKNIWRSQSKFKKKRRSKKSA